MLSQFIAETGLTTFPSIALVVFVVAFLLILSRTILTKKESFDEIAALPLAEDSFHKAQGEKNHGSK